MKRLRFWCAVMCVWFFVLYNVERFHAPINLASFVYAVAAFSAVVVCLWPRVNSIPVVWLMVAPIPFVLVVKAWLGYPIGGPFLTITITELVAIGVTVLLAYQLLKSQHELENSLAGVLVKHFENRSHLFASGQEELFREIRRARMHNRPLSLLAISTPEFNDKQKLPLLSKQFENAFFNKFIMARLADFLTDEMQDFCVVTQRNNHFVVLVPETDRSEAEGLIAALKKAAKDELQLNLNVGLSTFPDEEITMVSLLDCAERELQNVNSSRIHPSDVNTSASASAKANTNGNGKTNGDKNGNGKKRDFGSME